MTELRLAFAVAKYFKYGGMQRSMLRIAQECIARGHRVDIFTGRWEGDKPPALTVNVFKLRAFTNHGRNDELAVRFHQAADSGGYDCLVGFTKIPGLDIYYAGDPCLAAKLAATKPGFFRYLPRYRAFLRQEAEVFRAGKNTEILLIAHQEKDKFTHYYSTENERFHLLPPGIDRDRLLGQIPDQQQRQTLRKEFGIGKEQRLILNVGSGFRTKGIDRAIRALSALPGELRAMSRLVVVGKGKPAPYHRLARKLGVGDQVIFAGARTDVARFYYSADILIHPAYTENTGTTLIEAMICGLPVLTTGNCGFAHHIVQAQAGLICPMPFEQETLNRLLVEMLDPVRTAGWGANGQKYCATTDLYSLIETAADKIIARAERNHYRR